MSRLKLTKTEDPSLYLALLNDPSVFFIEQGNPDSQKVRTC